MPRKSTPVDTADTEKTSFGQTPATKQHLVYVINGNGKPLMPTQRGNRVRWLLKRKEARIVSMKPFTIQLNYTIENPGVQPLFGGIDPGRTNIGIAVVRETGEAVFSAHVATNNKDVPRHMRERKMHRQASRRGERLRRQRRAKRHKTLIDPTSNRSKRRHLKATIDSTPTMPVVACLLPRYKKPVSLKGIINSESRFCNRKRPTGWLTPTATNLKQTHLNIVEKVCRILPVENWTLELNKFAFMQLDSEGKIWGFDFQNGRLKGFDSNEAYVYNQQKGRCIVCQAPIEHYHHIVPRSKDGADLPENMVGLCSSCHSKIHTRQIAAVLKKVGQKKKYAALSVLNQAIPYILDDLRERFGDNCIRTCEGYETQAFRNRYLFGKDHVLDALCIAVLKHDIRPTEPDHVFEIKQYRRHDRQIIHRQTERAYQLNKKTVAKNRKARFGQPKEYPSLQDYLASIPDPVERRKARFKLTVKKSKRSKNELGRNLPGTIFYYKGKRLVMSGRSDGGVYLRAVGCGQTKHPLRECRIQKSGGLVFL